MSSSNYVGVLVAGAAAAAAAGVMAQDLSALRVEGQRGQSADQARRDRYECHNWAVEQTGQMPSAVPTDRDEPSDARRQKRAERANRAIVGAAIGSMIGGLTHTGGWHHRRDAGDAVLAGAAVGAAVGAATAGKAADEAAPPALSQTDYLRALTACLEGRGYTVTMPPAPTAATRRR
jgi:hypothetical protein